MRFKALTAVSTVFAIILLVYFNAPAGNVFNNVTSPLPSTSPTVQTRVIHLSQDRQQHILYGDARGGGHKFGVGKPCKSEFPQDWDDAEIIETVKEIAANDNLDWRREDNGYYVTETFEERVKVRVVLGPEKENIITAYPVNVKRNPCPAKPANDN